MKAYVKPGISFIQLRAEEGLACDGSRSELPQIGIDFKKKISQKEHGIVHGGWGYWFHW